MFEIRQRDTCELVDQHRHDQTRGVDDEGHQLLGGGPVAGENDKSIGVVGEQAAQDITDFPADQGVCPGGFKEVHGAEVDGGTDDSHDAEQHHCPGVFVHLPVDHGLSWASSTVWLGMRCVCGGQVLPRGAVDLNNFAVCSRYS